MSLQYSPRPRQNVLHRMPLCINPDLLEWTFVLLSALLLVASNHRIQQLSNIVYRLTFAGTVLLLFLQRDFYVFCQTRYVRPIAISLLPLLVYFAAGDGGDRLANTLYMLIRAIPLFYLGFLMARRPVYIRPVLSFILFGYGLSAGYDVIAHQSFSCYGVTREAMALNTMTETSLSGDVDDEIVNFIYYFPTLSFVAILGIAILPKSRPFVWWLTLLSILVIITSVMLSTWSAAVLIFGMGIVQISILIPLRASRGMRVAIFAAIGIVGIILVSMLGEISVNSAATDSGKFIQRMAGLPYVLLAPQHSVELLDDLTGGRLTIALISIRTFFEHPLFGIGDWNYDLRIGGHSFFADGLARYGLFGMVPLIFVLFNWQCLAIRNWRMERQNILFSVLLAFMTSYLLSNILNPYFLICNLDQLVFLSGGLICGSDYVLHQHARPGSFRNFY